MLTIRDVVVDPVLSGVSVAYKNENYIAEILMPVVSVTKQSGKYYKYDKAAFRRAKSLRAPGGKANEVEFGLTLDSYYAEDHALKEKIPFEVLDQAENALSPESDSVDNVTEMLMIDKEAILAAAMANTAVITQNTTLSGTAQWNDYTNSDPVSNINTAISTVQAAIGRRPNTLVFGQAVFNTLINHPDILERTKYTSAGSVNEDMIARIFNVKQVLVGASAYNSAAEGQTDSMGYIWGKHAWAVYISPSRGLKQITLGYTFSYQTRQVTKWDDQDEKARYVRVNDTYTQEFVAVEAAYLIKNAIA